MSTTTNSVMDLRALLERKQAEKKEAARLAAEARKTAATTTTATDSAVQPKQKRDRKAVDLDFKAAKELILELLKLGDPDAETAAEIEARYTQFHGLKNAVEKQVISDAFLASSGYLLPHIESQLALTRGDFIAISAEKVTEITAELKKAREATAAHRETEGHRDDCGECKERKTFAYKNLIYKSRSAAGIQHAYLVSGEETADWLRGVLSDRHKYQQATEEEFGTLALNAGADPKARYVERVAALWRIAYGEAVATIATVTKDNPFETPRYQDNVLVGKYANHGDFIVRGLGVGGDGFPRLELVPFEREHSRMYYAARRNFGGTFKYEAAKDDNPERAFYGLQDSGKRADGLRALLRKALGAKLERHNFAPGNSRERLAYTSGKPESGPTVRVKGGVAPTEAPAPVATPPAESRKARRTKKFGGPSGDGPKVSRPRATDEIETDPAKVIAEGVVEFEAGKTAQS